MNGYEAYVMLLALKKHFSDKNYDYIKYNGKLKITKSTYDNKIGNTKLKFLYEKLAKKPDLKSYLVSNLIKKDKWINEITDSNAEDTYRKWYTRNQALLYYFKSDLDLISTNLDYEFSSKNKDERPNVLTMYLENRISPETVLILNESMSFLRSWYTAYENTIIIPEYITRLWKYKSFLYWDEQKAFEIVLDKFKNG